MKKIISNFCFLDSKAHEIKEENFLRFETRGATLICRSSELQVNFDDGDIRCDIV